MKILNAIFSVEKKEDQKVGNRLDAMSEVSRVTFLASIKEIESDLTEKQLLFLKCFIDALISSFMGRIFGSPAKEIEKFIWNETNFFLIDFLKHNRNLADFSSKANIYKSLVVDIIPHVDPCLTSKKPSLVGIKISGTDIVKEYLYGLSQQEILTIVLGAMTLTLQGCSFAAKKL